MSKWVFRFENLLTELMSKNPEVNSNNFIFPWRRPKAQKTDYFPAKSQRRDQSRIKAVWVGSPIWEFLQGKRFGLVGYSCASQRFGYMIYTEFKQRGYSVLVAHPEIKEIGGEKCAPSVGALGSRRDGLIIHFLPRGSAQAVREVVPDRGRPERPVHGYYRSIV